MATLKQIREISIELNTYDGSFTPVGGYPKLYEVWNFDARWRADWLGGSANTRALSGFDRVGVGGFRLDVIITFRNMRLSQAQALRGLLNDVFAVPAFPRIIRISPDADISKGVYCNIRSAAYGIRRELTIGRQAVNMQFAGVFRESTIPDAFEIGTS